MSDLATFKAGEGIISDVVDGRWRLFDTRTERVLSLNRTAGFIWQEATRCGTAEMIAMLRDAYPDTDAGAIARDVFAALEELVEAGFLKRVGAEDT